MVPALRIPRRVCFGLHAGLICGRVGSGTRPSPLEAVLSPTRVPPKSHGGRRRAGGQRRALLPSRSHLVADLERVCDYLVVLVASHVQLAGEVPANQQVIEASHTDKQTTLLVRTDDPILDPAWTVKPVTTLVAFAGARPRTFRTPGSTQPKLSTRPAMLSPPRPSRAPAQNSASVRASQLEDRPFVRPIAFKTAPPSVECPGSDPASETLGEARRASPSKVRAGRPLGQQAPD